MKVIKNKNYAFFSIATLLVAGTLLYIFPPHFSSVNADVTGTDNVTAEWQWSVNVKETLTATVSPDAQNNTNHTGNPGAFLRNKYTLSVSSNNGSGFTAGMTTKETSTDLKNQTLTTATIPTLTSSNVKCADVTCTAFNDNFWGYSLDETTTGTSQTPTGTYSPLVGSGAAPITVASSETQSSSTSKDIYFGAKADSSKASGTYSGTVVFTVTSGTSGTPLPGPSGDVPQPGPGMDDAPSMSPSISDQAATQSQGSNVYTYTTGGRTYRSTADSIASAGSNDDQQKRSTADDFISPLGVNERTATTRTVSNIQHGSIITTILLIVASVAAGIGVFFFILARRRDREEDEDEIQQV